MGPKYSHFLSQDANSGVGPTRNTTPNPPPTPSYRTPPTPPTFNKPNFYAPRQSQLQRATYDPASTSHNSVQRFGVASHV